MYRGELLATPTRLASSDGNLLRLLQRRNVPVSPALDPNMARRFSLEPHHLRATNLLAPQNSFNDILPQEGVSAPIDPNMLMAALEPNVVAEGEEPPSTRDWSHTPSPSLLPGTRASGPRLERVQSTKLDANELSRSLETTGAMRESHIPASPAIVEHQDQQEHEPQPPTTAAATAPPAVVLDDVDQVSSAPPPIDHDTIPVVAVDLESEPSAAVKFAAELTVAPEEPQVAPLAHREPVEAEVALAPVQSEQPVAELHRDREPEAAQTHAAEPTPPSIAPVDSTSTSAELLDSNGTSSAGVGAGGGMVVLPVTESQHDKISKRLASAVRAMLRSGAAANVVYDDNPAVCALCATLEVRLACGIVVVVVVVVSSYLLTPSISVAMVQLVLSNGLRDHGMFTQTYYWSFVKNIDTYVGLVWLVWFGGSQWLPQYSTGWWCADCANHAGARVDDRSGSWAGVPSIGTLGELAR